MHVCAEAAPSIQRHAPARYSVIGATLGFVVLSFTVLPSLEAWHALANPIRMTGRSIQHILDIAGSRLGRPPEACASPRQ